MSEERIALSDLTTSFPQLLTGTATAKSILAYGRPLKLGVAAIVVGIGAYGVLSDSEYVSTTDAVVSAYVLEVRTPIAGEVADLPATPGDEVAAGATLGKVSNALVDRQHLDNLRMSEEVATSRADALSQERICLETERRKLLWRAAQHISAVRARLNQQLSEAAARVAAKQTSFREAGLELDRGQKLVGWGVIAQSAFDKLVAAHKVVEEELRAQQAELGSVQTQSQAAREGVLSEPGTNNDTAYSAQRADELTIKLAENERERAAARAEAQQARAEAEAEASRSSLLGSSDIHAPVAGRVWKLFAISGEHLEAHAPVFSMVDCKSQFVLARIPQERMSNVVLNSRAEVKLAGDSNTRGGAVMSISADGTTHPDSKLAAALPQQSADVMATVVIRLDSAPGEDLSRAPCLVGRNARVRIATARINLVRLWLSRYA